MITIIQLLFIWFSEFYCKVFFKYLIFKTVKYWKANKLMGSASLLLFPLCFVLSPQTQTYSTLLWQPIPCFSSDLPSLQNGIDLKDDFNTENFPSGKFYKVNNDFLILITIAMLFHASHYIHSLSRAQQCVLWFP